MRTGKLYAAFLTQLIIGLNCGESSAEPPKKSVVSPIAKEAWNSINNMGRKGDRTETMAYWSEFTKGNIPHLRKLVAAKPQDASLQYYVQQFGQHDAEADFRWVITLWWTTFGPHRIGETREKTMYPELFAAQDKIAKYQVQMFLKDPKLFDRYYRAVVWYGKFFRKIDFPVRWGQTRMHMKGVKSDRYWWHARNVLLYVHATGRDDLLKTASAETLDDVFDKWYAWLKENGPYLRPESKRPGWYLDNGEKEREEGYIPFLAHGALPPMKYVVENPFPNLVVPRARFFRQGE